MHKKSDDSSGNTHIIFTRVKCPSGSFYLTIPGKVIGLKLTQEQHVTGKGHIIPLFHHHSPSTIIGRSNINTTYESETSFFICHNDGLERFYNFPTKHIAIRDGHSISEIWARSADRHEDLTIALYNHNTRETIWLASENEIIKYFAIPSEICTREPIHTDSERRAIENARPWLILVCVVLLSLSVFCETFRSPESRFLQIMSYMFFGFGIFFLLTMIYFFLPNHRIIYEDNPEIDELSRELDRIIKIARNVELN